MLIEALNLGFYYKKDEFCFKDLNFSVGENEIVAILGLNGQGKSTLLYNLIGILKPKVGQIFINQSFSYLSQNLNLNFNYRVIDIVLMGLVKEISLFKVPSKYDYEKSINALEILGISHLKDRFYHTLSGGQKQLVLLARTIVSKSKTLILDEPFSAMDLKNQNRVLNLIKSLKNDLKISIIFTTHNPDHAHAVADKTLILYDDLSYKFGKSKSVLSSLNLTKLYGVRVKNVEFEGRDYLITLFDN
ncbi:ABC transporter ATP-binding protein [Campylobacter corcagiensis]|uniref:ABC transporter ATP-binding protein n=1 Tax=Campylobacter corcagiensis TaxID=1448857 RepID=UPI0004B437B4|nr:ABC transporter ATP-binding protein [Campylobacter corcagiensis]QKF64985.1 ABC transporter, ATP-binding protein [Campylobacter corcagiensis]